MPRLRSWTSLACLLCLAGCATVRPAPREPVYRYINVGAGDVVRLGDVFTRTDLAVRVHRTMYMLNPDAFAGGGTHTILLRVDDDRRVREMKVLYDGSEPLDQNVGDYTESLGPPVEASPLDGGGMRYLWQDAATRFELVHDPRSVPSFWSQLTDLAQPH
jgi:hypothetical protein